MSTQRREVAALAAQIDHEINDLYSPGDDVMGEDLAELLYASGYRKPRTITTVEELDALPVGSVVLTATGRPAHPFVASQKYDNNGDPIWHRGGRLGGSHGDYVIPATVLFEPSA